MWPTMNGLRTLKHAEADLVRRAVSRMVDQIVAEFHDEFAVSPSGIDWFDQWDSDQRLWLLEEVAVALLTDESPPSPAALWEATLDAIFAEIIDAIRQEMDQPTYVPEGDSWRKGVIDALQTQQGRMPNINSDETDLRSWRIAVAQFADMILGVACYQKAEAFRDGDIEQFRKFLRQRALPDDFLQRIPPLRTPTQTEQTLDRLRQLLLPEQ